MKVSVLFGGNSPEKGISINSARSLSDVLRDQVDRVEPIFFDHENRPFLVKLDSLYSNTPLDFEFKLGAVGHPLSEEEFARHVAESDLVFPAVHGEFGEGGELQRLLEKAGARFIGTGSHAAAGAFDKYLANRRMRKSGVQALDMELIEEPSDIAVIQARIESRSGYPVVVKPARSGSSIDVIPAHTSSEFDAACLELLSRHPRIVVEPFCRGHEFTIVIVANAAGEPVPLVPVQVRLNRAIHGIHDYRTKYLPSEDSSYLIPPEFGSSTIDAIRAQAKWLFQHFELRDVARIDGWVLNSGEIVFTDFNLASGLEQNSFLFIQTAFCGLSHEDTVRYILGSAASRYGIPLKLVQHPRSNRSKVNVLFGGRTAEANVSVMSGTNVWQRLLQSTRYEPVPRFVDAELRVWRLPYHMHLFHTVREISAYAEQGRLQEDASKLRLRVAGELGITAMTSVDSGSPKTLEEVAAEGYPVFIALHGGIGEDGSLQAILEDHGTRFTGSGSRASSICIDKWETGRQIVEASLPGISSLTKYMLPHSAFLKRSCAATRETWQTILAALKVNVNEVIVKPRADGCSAGVARLQSADDLGVYLDALRSGRDRLYPGALSAENRIIELPKHAAVDLLFEPFLHTMKFRFEDGHLSWDSERDWVEVTNGLLCVNGELTALPPSITVAQETVLSLEEKFQGGTGINITPPPVEIISEAVQAALKEKVLSIGRLLGLAGFARMDLFVHRFSGDVIVIEVNTIPALTPSTVFFHQTLAGQPPLTPREALEAICESGGF